MWGPEVDIHFKENIKEEQVAIFNPQPIPIAQRAEVKRMLDNMVAKGIIALVTKPTEWISPLVVPQKPNGRGLHLCVDLSQLNRFVHGSMHPMQTAHDAVAEIDGAARFFAAFDSSTATFRSH